jgi:hypothetical protein
MSKYLILLLALVTSIATAQQKDTEKQFSHIINLLDNPGAEFGLPKVSVTGGTLTKETANKYVGTSSFGWDASAASQIFRWASVAIPEGLRGKACLMKFNYLWDSGVLGDLDFTVTDLTNDLVTVIELAPTSGKWGLAQAAFICPESGSLRLEVRSTADAAKIYLDQAHLGSDYRVGGVSDSSEIIAQAIYTGAASCDWSRTNTAFGPFSSDADCTAITVQYAASGISIDTSDDDLPTLKINNLPAGKYAVIFTAPYSIAINQNHGFAISDGTTTTGQVSTRTDSAADFPSVTVHGFFEYTSEGSRTFQPYVKSSSGGVTLQMNSTNYNMTYSVYRFPTKSPRDTVTLETQGWFIDARVTDTVTGYSSLAAGDNVLANADANLIVKSGSAAAKIPCASPNPPTGTNCAVGNENVGVSFDAPYSGWFEICADVTTYYGGIGPAENFQTQYYWRRTSTTSATALDATERTVTSRVDELNASSVIYMNDSICQNWNLQAGNHVFRLAYVYSLTGAVTSRHMLNTELGTRITVKPITQNFPQAVAISDVPTGGTSAGCPNGENICSGTYVPTLSALTNVGGTISGTFASYLRVGNVMHISGGFNTTAATNGTLTSGNISLPISTNLVDAFDCSGSANILRGASSYTNAGTIRADGTNDAATFEVQNASGSSGSHIYTWTFTCRIL